MLGESWDYWISQKFDTTDTPISDVWLEVTIVVHPQDYLLTQATQNRYQGKAIKVSDFMIKRLRREIRRFKCEAIRNWYRYYN